MTAKDADRIKTPHGLPAQATNPFDRLLQAIWPSTQGDLSYSVYARLIERLYENTSALLIGYMTISVPALLIALRDSIDLLLAEVLFLMVPVGLARIVSCNRYKALPAADKFNYAYRDEARYFISTIAVVFCIGVINLTVIFNASDYGRLVMSVVVICYMTGIMARNAMSPRLVFVLSLGMALPAAYGLLLFRDPLALCAAVLIVGLTFYMSRIAYLGKLETVAALIQAEEAERLANYDVLTGLPNRHYMTLSLRRRLKSPRADGSLSLLMLDIDKFKAINDSRGHPLGDELLVHAATRIALAARTINPHALTARLGGDEFVVITDARGEATADAIISRMEEPFELSQGTIATSCSIGVMTVRGDCDEVALLKGADLALYAAKQAGRRRWRVYEPWMEEGANRAMLLETRFRDTLARNGLDLVFQPIVRFTDGVIVAYEALARWTDPVLGVVPPAEFVPFAEDSGLCDALSAQLLPRACASIEALGPDAAVSFNVSVAEFDRPDRLIQNIKDALSLSGLAPERLWIEITEGVLIGDFVAILATLKTIRGLGVKIALDDFGAGYSSLSYLTKLGDAIDAIKLDRSIVNDSMSDRTQEIVIRMVAEVAREIKANVVAECIEDRRTAEMMKGFGVTHAQGHYFGRPESALVIMAARAAAQDGGGDPRAATAC